MATNSTTKLLKQIAGVFTEFYAVLTSAGAADANSIPALNASGILDDSIINASATTAANKVAKMNGSGVLDDGIMGASAVSAASKVAKMNASGILDPGIVNAKVVSAGNGDAGKLPQLDATGKLDNSVLPVGVGAETFTGVASEALSAGNFVNIYTNGGVMNVRKADASVAGKEANGFVLTAVSASGTATVFAISQTNTQLTGLTAGAIYYLSDSTPGGVATAAPTTSAHVVQQLGRASSTTAMVFQPGPAITLA